MRTPLPQFRFRAVSMELAAHLDDHRVDMLVIAEDGTTIAVECQNDTILKIQRYIAKIARECPEIATWSAAGEMLMRDSEESRYNAAVSEGWPVRPAPTIKVIAPLSPSFHLSRTSA